MNTYLVVMGEQDKGLFYADDIEHALEQAEDLYKGQTPVQVFLCTSVWENENYD